MGIKDFKSKVVNLLFEKALTDRLPGEIGSVCIDINGIIHRANQEAFKYGDKLGSHGRYTEKDRKDIEKVPVTSLQKQAFSNVKGILSEILYELAPKDNFVLAVDGPSNMGKIKQQKQRRFKGAVDEDPSIRFKNVVITPGTPYMMKLDEEIQGWVESNKNYLPSRTIYSSHLDPGEGEHKIFDYLRKKHILLNKDENWTVVFGMDSDLIMLSLLSPVEKIVLVREDFKQYVDIQQLRYDVCKLMDCDKEDMEQAIVDFFILVLLLGNDFIPVLPSFPGTDIMLGKAIEAYKSMDRDLAKVKRSEDGKVDWKINLRALAELFDRLREEEEEMIIYRIKNPYKYPDPAMEECYNSATGYFDYKSYRTKWYCKEFCPRTVKGEDYFGELFYKKEDIVNMCLSYVSTFQWSLSYYTKGYREVSERHFYPYMLAPMLEDLVKVLERPSKYGLKESNFYPRRKLEKINAIEQLFMVIHPKHAPYVFNSAQLSVYQRYMMCVNPWGFERILVNSDKDWTSVPVIPSPNLDFTRYVLKDSRGTRGPKIKDYMVLDNPNEPRRYAKPPQKYLYGQAMFLTEAEERERYGMAKEKYATVDILKASTSDVLDKEPRLIKPEDKERGHFLRDVYLLTTYTEPGDVVVIVVDVDDKLKHLEKLEKMFKLTIKVVDKNGLKGIEGVKLLINTSGMSKARIERFPAKIRIDKMREEKNYAGDVYWVPYTTEGFVVISDFKIKKHNIKGMINKRSADRVERRFEGNFESLDEMSDHLIMKRYRANVGVEVTKKDRYTIDITRYVSF